MNFLKTLFGGGDSIKSAGEAIDKIFTSDEEKLERKNEAEKTRLNYDLEQSKLDSQALQNQTDINKIEAASSSLFVSGWRPAIGWICGLALAYASILQPLCSFVAKVVFNYDGEFPIVDTTITMQVLFGILGLGTLRTFEKTKNVANK
jgi:hypothetical protein